MTDTCHTKILTPPGSKLANIVRTIFPRKVYTRNFEQLFSDWQVEYIDALASNAGTGDPQVTAGNRSRIHS